MKYQSEIIKRGRYCAMPRAVLSSDRLNLTDKVIFMCLVSRLGPSNNRCWPTHAQLAAECRISERTVARSIDKLREMNFITVEQQQGGENVYFLEDPDEIEGCLFTPSETKRNPRQIGKGSSKKCLPPLDNLTTPLPIDGITQQVTQQQHGLQPAEDIVVAEVVKELTAAKVHKPTAIGFATTLAPSRIRDVIADARRQASSGRISPDKVAGRIVAALRHDWPLASAVAPPVDRAEAERRSIEKRAAENEAARNRERARRSEAGQVAWTEAEQIARLKSIDPVVLAAATAAAKAKAGEFHAKRFAAGDPIGNPWIRGLVISELDAMEVAGAVGQCA